MFVYQIIQKKLNIHSSIYFIDLKDDDTFHHLSSDRVNNSFLLYRGLQYT
jgi:hypothetical protein